MRITFLGHACFLLESSAGRVLIDPFLTGNPKAAWPASQVEADAILLTHGHEDHVGDTVSLARRLNIPVVAVAELATLLGWEGLNTCAQHIGGEHDYPFGRVKFTSATHGGGRMDEARHEVVYCGPAAGILYRAEGKTVYHLGDTGLTSDMALIGRHGVDVALVPIGGNYTMNGEDAAEAVRMIRPDCVVPMHYDTWPVIAADPQAFAAAVGETARVVVLEPGGVLSV